MYAAVHVLASGSSFRSQSWNRKAPLTVAAVPAYAPQPRKDKAEGLHGYTNTRLLLELTARQIGLLRPRKVQRTQGSLLRLSPSC